MRPFAPVLVCALATTTLAGCISTQATMLDPEPRGEVAPESVRVYRTPESIGCEYAEVALIHAQGDSFNTNENQMIKAAKKKAGAVGANGVVLSTIDEPSTGEKIAGALIGFGLSKRRGEMLAVHVFEPCIPLGGADGDEAADMEDEVMEEEVMEDADTN